MKQYKIYVVFIISLGTGSLSAQSFGFGCLGLSGVFGGYSVQQFDADGLQNGIENFYRESSVDHENIDFGKLEGYRFGANIFRAKFSNFFLTTKGYYQFLKKQDWSYTSGEGSIKSDEFQLSMNHWGLALDLGLPLFTFLDWKILEGGINFYEIEFDYQSLINPEIEKNKYSNDEVFIGYYAGTGLIIHIIPNYLSLEGTAIYNFLDFNNFSESENDQLGFNNSEETIIKGKFGAAVQLNIGVPL